MRDYFDAAAWLVGLGFWFASVIALFVIISTFDFNPLLVTLSFPIPFIAVASLYAFGLGFIRAL